VPRETDASTCSSVGRGTCAMTSYSVPGDVVTPSPTTVRFPPIASQPPPAPFTVTAGYGTGRYRARRLSTWIVVTVFATSTSEPASSPPKLVSGVSGADANTSGFHTAPSSFDSVATRRYGAAVPSVFSVNTVTGSGRRRSRPRSRLALIVVPPPSPDPARGAGSGSSGVAATATSIATRPIDRAIADVLLGADGTACGGRYRVRVSARSRNRIAA